MCGIAGIVAEKALTYSDVLRRMLNCLKHRGPDDRGIHHFEQCSMGHARLSVIDLAGGHQPMINNTAGVAITFNGEIYGYQDIKRQLSHYRFRTNSDTEVILALYEIYGTYMLPHLPGAFAFGIWDNTKELLFLTRDRFGEKPLYYAIDKNKTLIFASEIKAILASGLFEPKLSLPSVCHYLKHLYVHPHSTIYDNIHVLPPAHQLIYRDGKISISKYWQLPLVNDSFTLTNALEQFQFLINASVKKQLIADVPVAAFLSGGLDSSSIVSIASKYNANITTLSFGFGEAINELSLAKKVRNYTILTILS